MPDLKTALNNAIQEKQMQTANATAQPPTPPEVLKTVREWAADDMRARIPRTPQYTGFLTRDLFLFIQANPKSTAKQAENVITKLPYKYNGGSVGTLLSQMMKAGLMTRDDESRYSVAVDNYYPVNKDKTRKQYKLRKNKPVKQATTKPGPKPKTVVAVIGAEQQTQPQPQSVSRIPSNLDQLVAQLTFPQAIELYKKLRDMLGSATRMPLP